MKLKDWFKPNEDQTRQVNEGSVAGSSFENFKSNKPLGRTNIRKWRYNIYNSETFPLTPINLTKDSAHTVCLPPLEWNNFKSAPYTSKIINSGHTTIVKGTWYQGKKKPYLSGGPLLDQKYVFYHSHFHWGGSEHALEGESFPMELHNVFYNEKYKSHELALKEKDGIVIVVQFCQVSPEVSHRSYTVSRVKHHPSFPSSSFKSEPTRSQLSSIGENRKTGSYLRSCYSQLKNQNNSSYSNGYKTIPLKNLNPPNHSGIDTKHINEMGNHVQTTIDQRKVLDHNSRSPDLVRLQSSVEQNNVFVEEIAKNIRFVQTVNTSKLIHAYCLDRLVRQFIGNYYFYMGGIRRHQTVYRITWIVDDKNFLVLSKYQLRSFQLLKNAQNSKIIHNTRRTLFEPRIVGNLFYVINEGEYKQAAVSLGTPQPQQSKIENMRVSSNINTEDAAEIVPVQQILAETKQIVTSNKTQDTTIECSNIKTDLVDESPMIKHKLVPTVSEGETQRKPINTSSSSREMNKRVPDVPKQILIFETRNLEVENSKKILLKQEADMSKLYKNSPLILYENKKLQRSSEQNISSSMVMISDCKMKTSILNLCTEDFYDYLQALFKRIIDTIEFTIDVPYCSSLESTDTSVEQCNMDYYDEETIFKAGSSFDNSKLVLAQNRNATLSKTCEKMLQLFLPSNKRIQTNYKHSKRYPETKMKTMTRKVGVKENKLVLKDRYQLRKVKPCHVLDVMRVLVPHRNFNHGNLFKNIYHDVQSLVGVVGHEVVVDEQRQDGCFLDSSLFQPISIPSFSTDIVSSMSTVVNTLVVHPKDKKSSDISFDERNQSLIHQSVSCHQSVACYKKEKSPHVEANVSKVKPSIDTKIPRPKTMISERKKINLNLSVQKPLSSKTTTMKFPASNPPDMTTMKFPASNPPDMTPVQDSDILSTKTKPTSKLETQNQSEQKTDTVINKPFLTSPETNLKETNTKEDAPKTNIEVIESRNSFSKIQTTARRAKIYAKKYKLRPRKRSKR